MIQELATGGILHRPSPDVPGGFVAGHEGALLTSFRERMSLCRVKKPKCALAHPARCLSLESRSVKVSPEEAEPPISKAGRPRPKQFGDIREFVVRVAVVAGAVALLFLAWQARHALMLIFAAIIVAVIFDAASRPFRRFAGFSRRWALGSAALVIALGLGLAGWLVGARVTEQFGRLVMALREAEPTILGWLGVSDAEKGSNAGDSANGILGSVSTYVDWTMSATSWGLGAIGALGSFVLVIVAGYFLASEPLIYRDGVTRLFPKDQRERVAEALEQGGAGLFQWLKGQFVSMAMVGALIGIGTWIIGLPAPLALGLFAGLAAFVPVVGSVAGAAPALAIAAAQGGSILLWVAALILAVQQLESNMIMPMVERHMVHIPPALLLLNVFLFGAVFGGVGVIVAAPLTVAVFVLIKKLYVSDVLGHEVELPA